MESAKLQFLAQLNEILEDRCQWSLSSQHNEINDPIYIKS